MLNRRSLRGFTLIEMMVTVAIIAVLAAIAYPSYQSYVRRAARAAAQSFMMTVAARQEQNMMDVRSYASSVAALGLTPPAETNGRYSFTVTPVATPPSFTVTATAIGSQVQDGGPLTLTSTGVKSPANLWK